MRSVAFTTFRTASLAARRANVLNKQGFLPAMTNPTMHLGQSYQGGQLGQSAAFSSQALSQGTVDILKATVPVLAEHGYAITRSMYAKMLTEHPEVKAMFNPAHQVQLPGDEHAQQPWALACSFHAYAANVDDLSALEEAINRIAEKHVSLNVLPEHYPVVEKNFLWAVQDVLGDAATPEVCDAYQEAFQYLANIFIEREKGLRESRASQVGGWEGWRDFDVVDKVQESSEIVSLYLKPSDGGKVISYKPGSYTAVRIEEDDWITQRNYTLSKSPGSDTLRITVKRQAALLDGAPVGQVSNHIHDNVEVGAVLKMGVPCGDFILQETHDKPIVLISGGVGLTPTISMLEYLIENEVKNNIVMVNASRNPEVEAMHDVLAKYRRKHLNLVIKTIYDEPPEDAYPQGPISMDHLDQVLTSRDNIYYFCGPSPFMRTIYKGLNDWGIPKDQIHFEFFGPHDDLLK